jgi:23S rRNA (guanosine2251-2'-O)-methyltransferase
VVPSGSLSLISMRRRSHKRPAPSAASPSLVFGAHPVTELLRASPDAIERLWVVEDGDGAPVRAEAARAGVAVESADRATLDRMTAGGHHQGVAARTRPFTYADLDDLFSAGATLLVALDGVTDPQNLGAIVRSAEVLGAGGLLLPRDRSASVTPAAIRASAGATAHLPIAQVVNLNRALRDAKEHGYWIVGLVPEGTSTFQELPPLERAVLVIGSEDKGARPLVLEHCDFRVRIPQRGKVESLNASVAAAIGLYALAERLRTAGAKPS